MRCRFSSTSACFSSFSFSPPGRKSQVSFWVFIFPNIERQTQTRAKPQTFRYRVDQVKLGGAESFPFLIGLERVGSRKMEWKNKKNEKIKVDARKDTI